MALTVGELVAYIRADGTQFDRQVDQSGQKFQALGSIVSTGTKTIAASFTAVTAGATALGTHVFKIGADYNRLQQSSRAALTTLLGSAQAANAQMDKLDEFARSSPFAKQVFIQAQQQLLGFGVSADKVLPTLDAIQQAVAATGGSNEQITALTDIFAKISSSAKITAEDLNQFGTYGVDAATLIGEQMGKTGAEIRESISKGSLDAEDAIAALTTSMMDRFGGATANIKLQYDGAVDRIKGATRDIGSLLAAPFIDPNGGGRAVEWANKVADALRALQAKVDPLVDVLVGRLTPAFDKVTPALDQVRSTINGWDITQVNDQLDALGKYAPLIAGVAAGLLALGGNTLGLGRLGLALNPVVAGIAALVATSPELRAVGRDFLTGLQPVLPILGEVGRTTADVAMELLRILSPALRDVANAAAPVIVALATGLSPALTTTLHALLPVAEVVGTVASALAELPTPVLTSLAAFMALRGAIGPLNNLVGVAAQGMSTFVTSVKGLDAVRAYQAGLSPMSAALVGVNQAAGAARAGIGALGTALKTAFISNPVGLAVTALATALGVFAQASAQAEARADSYADAVKLVGEEAEIAAGKVAASSLVNNDDWGWWQQMKSGYDSAADAVEGLGLSLEKTTQVVGASRPEFDAYIQHLESLKDTTGQNWGAIQELQTKLMQQRTAWEDAAHGAEQMERATGGTTDEAWGAVDAMNALNTELQENADLNLSAAEAALRAEDAQARVGDAIRRAKEAQEESNKVTADGNATEDEKATAIRESESATRDAEEAILSSVRAQMTAIEASRKNGEEASVLRDKIMKARESFIDQRIAMGDTRAAAEKLADQYGLIPKTVLTKIQVQGLTAADAALRQFETKWNGKTITVSAAAVTYSASGGMPGGGTGTRRNSANGSFVENGHVKAFADGGIDQAGNHVPRVSQMAQGGREVTWAEAETGWEAYISGKPSMRNRNIALWQETGRRLGVIPAARYADGALVNEVPVPVATGGDQRPSVTLHVTVGSVTDKSQIDYLTDEVVRRVTFATAGSPQ